MKALPEPNAKDMAALQRAARLLITHPIIASEHFLRAFWGNPRRCCYLLIKRTCLYHSSLLSDPPAPLSVAADRGSGVAYKGARLRGLARIGWRLFSLYPEFLPSWIRMYGFLWISYKISIFHYPKVKRMPASPWATAGRPFESCR